MGIEQWTVSERTLFLVLWFFLRLISLECGVSGQFLLLFVFRFSFLFLAKGLGDWNLE